MQDQMEALRECLAALTKDKLKPDEFPPGLIARAGISVKDCKVKAIEKKIQELRSVVSKSTKQDTKNELEKEAEALGITVEEMLGKDRKANKDPDHKQDHDELKKGRASDREKKQQNAAVARGDFDLTAHRDDVGQDD